MAKRSSTSDFTVVVTQVSFAGKENHKHIRVEIDGTNVEIPVSAEVYAYWQEQFVRPNPTVLQRKRFGTMMQVVRAAFKAGQKHANNG